MIAPNDEFPPSPTTTPPPPFTDHTATQFTKSDITTTSSSPAPRRAKLRVRGGKYNNSRNSRNMNQNRGTAMFHVSTLKTNSWECGSRIECHTKKSAMTEDRKSLLESIGFVWELRSKDTWRKQFKELKKYATKEGHCNETFNFSKNKQLGMLVKNRISHNRLLREGKKSTMTKDRKSLLESIGFVWDLIKDTWRKQFKELKKYAAKEGHCNVTFNYSENKQLGMWVKNQIAVTAYITIIINFISNIYTKYNQSSIVLNIIFNY